MRLIEKFILLMVGLSLPPLVIAGTFFYYSVKSTLETETIEQLNSIATVQKDRLNDMHSQNLKRLTDFSSRQRLKVLLASYNNSNHKTSQAAMVSILKDAKEVSPDIQSIAIRDTKGVVVASSETDAELKRLASSKVYNVDITKRQVRLINQPGVAEPDFYLSGPLVLNGQTVGSVGIIIDADELRQVVADHTGLGETGEIVLGRRLESGQPAFIAPLRFDSQAANKIITDASLPMNNALQGEEAVFSRAKDYRGHTIIAATRYIQGSEWGLVVKMDRSEALQPIRRLRNELLLLAFINSVLVVFFAIALARRFSQPILDIDEVAEQTARGNLKSRIKTTSKDEIGNLAQTFNHMLDNLEEFDKAKSDFISVASHQLRTPLTSVKWATEELIDSKAPLGKAKLRQYLQQIHDSNERMIELVNALLNVSKIDVGTLPFKKESVALEEVLDQVLSDIDTSRLEKNIVINKKVDPRLPSVDIDANWMRVILQNLLSNSIRYSPPDRKIDVWLQKKPKHVLIQVKDQGYGIPKAQQANIFTKFYRAENAHTLGSEGSGLGLYITKSMVERAGGSIRFESVENKGTTFYVKLPSNI